MTETNHQLVAAIARRERDIRDLIHRIDMRDLSEDLTPLKEAAELVGCLRRLVPGCTADEIHKAFGAPGDFGYETLIGDALARIYGVRR